MAGQRVTRRQFTGLTAAGLAGGVVGHSSRSEAEDIGADWLPDRPPRVTGSPLRVQPILMYSHQRPREVTSWRSWGRISNPSAAAAEGRRISKQLQGLSVKAGFPLDFLPVVTVTSEEEAAAAQRQTFDVVLVYAATGSSGLLRACFAQEPTRDTVIFARHRSGPVYYWYEALSTRQLQTLSQSQPQPRSIRDHGAVTVDDVVIDDEGELQWRLRALYGLKNFVGRRILALGGPWGKYDDKAPQVARDRYGIEIVDLSYEDLARRIELASGDRVLRGKAEQWTDRYLSLPGTTLATKREYVVRAFLSYAVVKAWLAEHDASAFTVKDCMSRILPVIQTTPCMVLSWLNDEGLPAFCESDFVVIPAGILLHYVSGTPVYLHNSTFPHQSIVTCAHCSAPRRMDGKTYCPTKIMTHYESDYGAAPKVDMEIQRKVTFVDPEYSHPRWLGFTGTIRANPSLDICRTQQDVEIDGDWKQLKREVRDSHWVMTYDDCLQELGYAARKIGLEWVDLSET
jgi:hypothetical protein